MNFDFLSDYDFPTNVFLKRIFYRWRVGWLKAVFPSKNLFSDKVLGNWWNCRLLDFLAFVNSVFYVQVIILWISSSATLHYQTCYWYHLVITLSSSVILISTSVTQRPPRECTSKYNSLQVTVIFHNKKDIIVRELFLQNQIFESRLITLEKYLSQTFKLPTNKAYKNLSTRFRFLYAFLKYNAFEYIRLIENLQIRELRSWFLLRTQDTYDFIAIYLRKSRFGSFHDFQKSMVLRLDAVVLWRPLCSDRSMRTKVVGHR